MKKVISFSLWGNKSEYTIGAIKNAELAMIFYPDFECWFYIHKPTVPEEIIEKLEKLTNTKIIIREGDLSVCKPSMWRFEPIDLDDVEIMMCRDTDTRIYLREKIAVDKWIESGKTFHIMRDHPHHNFTILAGMFGTKKIPGIKNWAEIMECYAQTKDKFYDQNFLNEFIYPVIKNDSLIHANFNQYEGPDVCEKFPIGYDSEYRFVGEYVYADESRSPEHINELKNSLGLNLTKFPDISINLITSFYHINKLDIQSIQRNNEITLCLYKNLQHKLIKKIHLYVDDIYALNKVLEIGYACGYGDKIKIIKLGSQPMYSDMFEYAIDNLSNQVCMISNSDIYLYQTDIDLIKNLSSNVYALSRHESDLKCKVLGWGSHDAFIFNPTFINKNVLPKIQHVQNLAGSDDNIINVLVDSGLKLYNPCFQIMIIHLHNSELRTYSHDKIAHGKYFIKQEYLDPKLFGSISESAQIEPDDFVFFQGVDYMGGDIAYNSNTSVELLKKISRENSKIIAFNTLGFLKEKINIAELKPTQWIGSNDSNKSDGIYIKKELFI